MLDPVKKPGFHGFLTGLVLCALANTLAAQQQSVPDAVQLDSEEEAVRRYSVELIVFEYVGQAANTTEIFEPEMREGDIEVLSDEAFFGELTREYSDRPVMPQPSSDLPVVIEVPAAEAMAAEDDEPFVPLPGEELEEIPTLELAGIERVDPADYQLRNTWQKLVNIDAYRPLMHTAWIQPTLDKEETEPLKLRRIGNPPLRLDGTITLYLSRFLHLVVDLSLENRSAGAPGSGSESVRYYGDNRSRAALGFESRYAEPSIIYRINEDRIVRNNELRYYDHPKFGVIARITRIEEEMPDDLDTTDDLLPGNPVQ